ncbi:LPD38 domain-containing protein [uncultured Pseudomonas sp.]|uniref:LPD38 domain-containing protein n=1 Tax=uncultured Pseudomonas sp. TaxID=114707 RepID=UPI0025DFA422|nr:LPD38 domain-containing protein [uncultured Pseudomonas sp.]
MAFDPSSAKPDSGALDPTSAKPASLGGELKKGVSAGIDSLQAAGYGLAGLAGDAVGSDSLRDWGLEGYQRNQKEAAENAPAVGSYRDVGSLRDAGLYLANGLGQLAPFAASSLASAGTGGLVVGAVRASAGKAAERFAENRIAQGVARAAGRLTPAAGAQTAAVANSIGTEQGSIYGDIYDKTGEYAPGTAAAYGAVAGALDVAPELALASRVLGKGASQAAKESFGKGLLKQTALEGSTEAGQSAVENLAVQNVDPNQRAFSEDNLHGMVDAAILGAAGGGVAHTGGHLIGKVANRGEQPQEQQAPAAPSGPLTKALGNTPALPAPERLGLPAPDTLYTGADGQTSAVGPNINVDGTVQPAAQSGQAFVAPENRVRPLDGEGMEQQVGETPLARQGEYQEGVPSQGYQAAELPPQGEVYRGELTDSPRNELVPVSAAEQQAPANAAERQGVEPEQQAAQPTSILDQARSAVADNVMPDAEAFARQSGASLDDARQALRGAQAETEVQATAFKSVPGANKALASLPEPDRFEVVKSGEREWKIQPRREATARYSAAPAESGEWARFDTSEQSLGVPRAEMPQVKAENRGALVNFLRSRGVESDQQSVPAQSLKPTQAEFSPERVARAVDAKGDRSILVSSDGYVLDGHHQWLAAREQGADVKVLRLDAPMAELLPMAKEFPSSTQESGDARYRGGLTSGSKLFATQIRAVADKMAGATKIPVHVVAAEADLPTALYRQIQRDGAQGRVEGVWFNGQVYLVGNNLSGARHAAEVILHEVFGHAGVRAALGDRLNPVLDRVYRGMSADERAELEADYAGQLDGVSPGEARRIIAEEHLARLAETSPRNSLVMQAIAAIKQWVRETLGLELGWSHADFVELLAAGRRALGAPEGDALGGDTGVLRYSLKSPQQAADLEAFRKLGLVPEEAQSLADRVREAVDTQGGWKGALDALKRRANEGIFDGLAGIKYAEDKVGVDPMRSGYVSARLATGLADVMHGVLHYGAPQWKDGVLQYKDGTRGLLETLADLGGDNLTDWLAWVGGKRAELLKAQGRENNLSDAEIRQLLDVGDRGGRFQAIYDEYAKLNDAMLDVAEGAGLIGKEQRASWQSDYYIPFYRMQEEDGESTFLAPKTKQGLSHQSAAIKQLKGGKLPTNDLLANLLTNWSKRLDASLKNKALLDVVDNLKDSPYLEAEPNPGAPARAQGVGFARDRDDIIRVQRDGRDEYYKVQDKALLRAVTAMSGMYFKDPVTTLGRKFKQLLTTGITASPDFILRNFIRDSAQAWITNPDKFKLGVDSVKGLKAAFAQDADYRALMFAGASFQGGYAHGNDPQASAAIIRRALKAKGLNEQQTESYLGSIIGSNGKLAEVLGNGWEKYREISDRIENANRLSTYKAARAAGKDARQAAFEAKDLMDFSMRGNFTALQWLTDVVPFLNARLQGLGKLGRSYRDDKGKLLGQVVMKAGMLAAFSLVLAALNGDDERYQQLAEWDKDSNWHFWLSSDQVEPFRIPKPFELGLIFGTLPERLLHFADGTQDAERLGGAVARGVVSTLSFNPIPQFYMPIRDIQANRNLFFDSPIEGFADEGKLSEARYDENTSRVSRALGQLTGPTLGISPKQLDYLVKAYTGTLGAYVLGASDLVAHSLETAAQPALTARQVPLLSVIYKGSSPGSTQYQTDLYDMMTQADQLYRTATAYRAEGKVEEAQQLLSENADKLKHRPALGLARQQLGMIRKQMDMTYRDEALDSDAKRERLDTLQYRANQIAERVAKAARPDF